VKYTDEQIILLAISQKKYPEISSSNAIQSTISGLSRIYIYQDDIQMLTLACDIGIEIIIREYSNRPDILVSKMKDIMRQKLSLMPDAHSFISKKFKRTHHVKILDVIYKHLSDIPFSVGESNILSIIKQEADDTLKNQIINVFN